MIAVDFLSCVRCRKYHDEDIETHPPARFVNTVNDLEYENCSFCLALHYQHSE